jgi:hypothetical protein
LRSLITLTARSLIAIKTPTFGHAQY